MRFGQDVDGIGKAAWPWAIGTALAFWLALDSPAAAQSFRHCGEINRNETWTAQDAHIVECDVQVRNSTLTIAPNVQVLMGQGTSLIIEPGAKLEILGDPDNSEPVRIVPNSRDQAQGFWGQIRVEPGAEASRIQYAIIFGGGSEGRSMIDIRAPTELRLLDLRGSGGWPLAFDANVLGPSTAAAGQNLSMGICNDLQLRPGSHARDEILIHASGEIDLGDSQFWHDFCLPYRVDDLLAIGGPDRPTLSLNSGVEIRFGPEAGLLAGVDAGSPGQFEANGEEDDPVRLTGLEARPGSWLGVELSEHADPGASSALFYTRIEYGGSPQQPMLLVEAPSLIAESPVFAGAPGYPVAIVPRAVSEFTGGIRSAEAFQDNAVQRIRVLADSVEMDLPVSAEWSNPGVPLEIDGDLRVASPDVARFFLGSGLDLVFAEGSGLYLGDAGAGEAELYVEGSRIRPVTMRGASEQPGSWRGLVLGEGTRAAEVEYLSLGQGGAGGEAMLDWGDTEGLIVGSLLQDAAGPPLAIALSAITAVAGEDHRNPALRNRFEDNAGDQILVRVDERYGSSGSERVRDWAEPGLPLRFDEDLVVAADGGLLLRLHGAMELRFAPGKALQIGQEGLRGTLDVQAGDSEMLTMRPEDGEAGWAGLRVEAGSVLEGDGLRVEGVEGADSVALAVEDAVVGMTRLELLGEAGRGTGIALSGEAGRLELSQSTVRDFSSGIRSSGPASLVVQRSIIAGNAEWGLHSEGNPECQLATLVYWGDPGGPTDPSDAQDDCMDLAFEGGGDRVSDGVVWWRYAIDEQFTPASGIGPGAITVFLPSLIKGVD